MRRLGNTTLEDYGEVLLPEEAQEPILARGVREALTEWLTEIWAKEALEEVGLQPRRRAMFDGPPGVGKTTLAHHLAARLGLPMLVVRSDRLIDAYIGSSGRNIGALFDLAEARTDEPIILFFDEFDSLAQKRLAARQGADTERNHTVNVLLKRVEEHEGFIIAATNRGSEIDEAVWRRFQIQIALALPGQAERERILARYLAPYVLPKKPLTRLAEGFDTASPALMREFAEGLKRRLVIGPSVGWDMSRDSVIERVLATVNPHPDIGTPRLWSLRLKDAGVQNLPWPLRRGGEGAYEAEIDADEAERMGRDAASCGKPIIENPFPFGDERRPRWDKGWRLEAGNDGMGPGDAPKVVNLRGERP